MKHDYGNARLTLVGTLTAMALAGVVTVAASGFQTAPQLAQSRSSVWPTYHKDVQPIIQAQCASCHTDGGIAPFALTDAKEVTARAADIARVVKNKSMPPWMPGPDSAKFMHERKLSVAERTTIADWVVGGAKLGDPVSSTTAGAAPKQKPDATLSMQPYTPSNKSQDDYRCFLIDPKVTEDRFVTGFRINPGSTSVVHHVIVYKMEGDDAAKATALDQQTGGKGWTCFGGPNIPDSPRAGGNWLGAWVPGSGEVENREGTGVPLPKGTKLVLQMHYNLANGVKPDQTSVDLFYAPEGAKLQPIRTALLLAPVELPCPKGVADALCERSASLKDNAAKFGERNALIPDFLLRGCKKTLLDYADAGDASNVPSSCDYTLPATAKAFTLYGLAEHMHLRGRSSTIELNPGTPNARMLLDIPKWDFNWQGFYQLQTPVVIKAGDTIRLSCHHDNSMANASATGNWASSQHRYIVWGEGTEDEMCLGVLSVGPAE